MCASDDVSSLFGVPFYYHNMEGYMLSRLQFQNWNESALRIYESKLSANDCGVKTCMKMDTRYLKTYAGQNH